MDGGEGRMVNQMTRDYWFDRERTSASAITTSSFCAVHELATPLFLYKDAAGNPSWDADVVAANAAAAKRMAAKGRQTNNKR